MTRTPYITLHYGDNETLPLELIQFTLSLDSMPLDSADSSGGVGEVTFVTSQTEDPMHPLARFGTIWAQQKKFSAQFETGEFTGYVLEASIDDTNGTISFVGTTIGHELNLYNIAMPPMHGTLQQVLRDYLDNIGAGHIVLSVDPSVASRQVVYPGWTGEFWLHMKLLCAAEELDLQLINDRVEVFPSRYKEANIGMDSAREYSMDGSSFAQYVEVYNYNNRWVNNHLVYPPGGWSEDVEILSVGAGEYAEHIIELSTSLVDFQTPTMETFVGMGHTSSSVYTVVGDDGFPVQPAQWADYGGHVSIEMGEEFHSMVVRMRGAVGIIGDTGDEIQTFSLALSSATGGGSYSTLRIVGTGTQYDRNVIKVATGVHETRAATEVGVSIDNPFLSSMNQAMNAAVRAATKFQGFSPRMSASSQGILLDAGILDGETLTHYVGDSHVYRTREVTYAPEGLSVTAEGDTRVGDVHPLLGSMTCGEFTSRNPGMTCRDFRAMGLQVV